MAGFHVACQVGDLADGEGTTVQVGDKPRSAGYAAGSRTPI